MIHSILRWGSKIGCDADDVRLLVKYLESQGRDCHINTGVHGTFVDGKFEFVWNKDGGDLICQDVLNFRNFKNKISVHPITRKVLPCYHAGVDTIDAFCYSWERKLTEKELDQIYEDFCEKEGIEPDAAEEAFAGLNLQEKSDNKAEDFVELPKQTEKEVQQDEKDTA